MNMAKDFISHYGSMEFYSSGFHVYFIKPFVLCCPWGWGNVDFAMGKQEKKKSVCVWWGRCSLCCPWGNVDSAMGKQEKKKRLCLAGKVLPKG